MPVDTRDTRDTRMPPPLPFDPSLLPGLSGAPTQPGPVQPVPVTNPTDIIGAALNALAASGATVQPVNPTLYSGDYTDTNLQDPQYPAGDRPLVHPVEADAVTPGPGMAPTTPTAPVTPPDEAQPNPQPNPQPGAQPNQQQNPLAGLLRPVAPGDAQGQAAQEQRAIGLEYGAKQRGAMAATAAQQSQAERLYQTQMQSAHDLEVANSLYQQSRQAAQQEADQETQAWLSEYQMKAQQEPNAGRWWDNLSGLGKALWGLSMVFGAAHAAITPGGQNLALQMVDTEIQRDIQRQKDRLDQELSALKAKGKLIDRRQVRNMTDLADDHSMYLGRLEALKQAYLARASAPGAADMQAQLAQVDAWFAEKEGAIAGRKYQTAVQIKENQLQRAHSTYLAKLTDTRDREIAAANLAAKYDLARMSQNAETDRARMAAMKDVEGVPLRLGAKMVDSPLGTDVIQVSKENAVKMRGVFNVANQRYDNLRKVKAALEDGSFSERMATGDPELISAARYLGYTTGKELDPAGRLSDQDVKFATAIDLGFDPAGGPWERSKFELHRGEIAKMIEREMQAMPKKVSLHAETYLNPNLVGNAAHIVWSPQQLFVPEQATPNMTEALSSAGLGPTVTVPTSVEDFERRRFMEESDPMFRGRELPAYDKGAVNEFAASVQGVSPKMIRQLADATAEQYTANTDPWDGPVGEDSPSDVTTRLAIESVALKAIKDSEARVKRLKEAAYNFGYVSGLPSSFGGKPTRKEIIQLARKDIGLTEAPDEIEAAVTIAIDAYNQALKNSGMGMVKEK